jgi:hypothetical protein
MKDREICMIRSFIILLFTNYCVVDQSNNDKIGGAYSMHGEDENCVQILVGKPEANRPYWRHWSKCDDNIKVDVKEIWCEGMDWIHLKSKATRHDGTWGGGRGGIAPTHS